MNRKKVDAYLPDAIEALNTCGIAQNGKIVSTFRGCISSFGAAVTMGSFKSAVAFFSDEGDSDVKRDKLIEAIWLVIKDEIEYEKKDEINGAKAICEYVLKCKDSEIENLKNLFLDASIALKLAMNAYLLINKRG